MPGQKREAGLRAGRAGHQRRWRFAASTTWMAGTSPAMTGIRFRLGVPGMTDPIARSVPPSGAGVLELLRLFASDQAAADRYAAACLERAKAIEPKLRA